jgi:hypothetical protein
MYASQLQANLPTPGVGVWERISIAAFMAWIVVLAITLLRGSAQPGQGPEREQHRRDQAPGSEGADTRQRSIHSGGTTIDTPFR